MKKIIFVFFIIILIGCGRKNDLKNNSIDKKSLYKEDRGQSSQSNYTFKFYGETEHFLFETGKVYYGSNNERYILLKNFKLKKDFEREIKYLDLVLSFNDISLIGGDLELIKDSSIDEYLSKIMIEEEGEKNDIEYDSFTITEKDEFKDKVKIGIKYCFEKNECNLEYFKVNYVD